jgi:hypothetical protein
MPFYYGWQGEPIDRDQWARLFADERHVGDDEIDGVQVSTVYVGLDLGVGGMLGTGPPLIFESMVFGGPLDSWTERYSSEREARAGHARVVELVRLEAKVGKVDEP